MARLTPAACVSLLEQAQCGSEADAARTLRQVISAGEVPHPLVTEALFQLLQVHPKCTIPHVPDLVSSSAADVATAVEAFAELLPTDRGLLVPILGALGDMPLSKSHLVSARATLKFALNTVDSDDLPAVVRSMLICSTKSLGLAKQTVSTLRSSLQRNLPHHVGGVLSFVVSEYAKSKSQVGKAFRTSATPYPTASGLDLVVWLTCLQRARVAFDAIGDEVTDCIRVSAKSGALLSTPQHKLSVQVDMAARVARESPEGVVALIDIVIESLSQETLPIHEHLALIFFVSRLLKWCSAATNSVVSHLSRAAALGSEMNASRLSEIVLLGLIPNFAESDSLRLGRAFSSPHSQLPSVAISLAIRSDMWNDIFVRMRKGIVFGGQVDRSIVCKLAYHACETGDISVMKQVVSLMNSSVSKMFSDSLAVSFLAIVIRAVMNGALDAECSKSVLEERIQLQVPNQLFSLNRNGDDNKGIQVDIAAINDKNPNAVSPVVGAGLALFYHVHHDSNPKKRSLASLIISSTVLIPVGSHSLYEAARHYKSSKEPLESDEDESCSQELSDVDDEEFKPKVKSRLSKIKKLSGEEFEDAVEGCITSIAAFIGLINTACVSFPNSPTWNLLKVRTNGALRYAEGVHLDDMWALLDRLSDMHIMLQGLRLAGNYTGFVHNTESDDASDEEPSNFNQKLPPMLRERLENVLNGRDFPTLSLSAAICGLVAVPEEKLESDLKKCTKDLMERHEEYSKIEEILLRRLLTIISTKHASCGNEAIFDVNSGGDYFSLPKISIKETSDLIREIKGGNDDQIFLAGVNTKKSNDKELKRRRTRDSEDDWASPLSFIGDDLPMNRMFRFSSCLSSNTGQKSDMEILYSPEFAGMLLDRAIMNVFLCSERRRRLGITQRDELKSGNKSAGFSLSILIHLLMDAAIAVPCEDEEKVLAVFIASMGKNAIVEIEASDESKDLVQRSGGCDYKDTEKIINGLVYISKTSVDATTAILSVDILALLAEYGVICSGQFRKLCLSSTTETLYEFNDSTLWGTEDFDQVQASGGRSVQHWISRKRRCGSQPSSDDEVYKNGPWITVTKGTKFYRLCQLFNGLYTLDAAIEATSIVEVDLKKPGGGGGEEEDTESSLNCNSLIPQVQIKRRVIFDTQVLAEVVLDVVANGLLQLKCETNLNVAGSLNPTWVSLTYWWARCVHGLVEHLGLKFEKYMNQLTASILHPLRVVIDGNHSSYSDPRTDVCNISARTLYELEETNGFYLTGIIKMATKISSDLKQEIINMKQVRKGRSGRGIGMAKLENCIEGLKRTASSGTKMLGKYKSKRKEVGVRRGDGIEGFKRRHMADEELDEDGSDDDDEEVDGSGSEEEERRRKDTVVISFRNVQR